VLFDKAENNLNISPFLKQEFLVNEKRKMLLNPVQYLHEGLVVQVIPYKST
jgi:hypothetical protein